MQLYLLTFILQRVALDHGLILVDTKYEFGKGPDGQIYLIDEVSFRWPCFSLTMILLFLTEDPIFCFQLLGAYT